MTNLVERLHQHNRALALVKLPLTETLVAEAADEIERLQAALAEAQARNVELRESAMDMLRDPNTVRLCKASVTLEKLLSRPADYSALSEALARECERLANLGWYDYISDNEIATRLLEEAAAHRGGNHAA